MNSKQEQPAGKKTLEDTLLALDSRMPSSLAKGREVAKEALRRDRRRIRILTWATMGFFLLTVIGICGGVLWYNIKIVSWMNWYQRVVMTDMGPQICKLEPHPSEPGPLASTALLTGQACHVLYMGQLATMGGIVALLAVMLAAAFCTILLIRATRGATLRQIQASLLILSEQFDTLQQSLQGGHSSGGGQATQEPSAPAHE